MASMTVLNVMDRQLLAVLIEPIKHDLDVSDAAMGLLTGTSFALLHAGATLPIARWADRGVRRTIIAGGLALWSGLTILTGLARGFTEMFVIRVGVGIGEATGGAPAQSLLSDFFPRERRATALAVHVMGGPLGSMVAFAGGGWLAESFGWRTAFFIFGAPGLLLALLIRTTLREPKRGATESVPLPPSETLSLWRSLRFLWALPSFRHLVLACTFNSAGIYAVMIWAVPYLMRVHSMSNTEAGLRLAIGSALFTALGTFCAGPISDRLSVRDVRWLVWLPAITSAAVAPFAWGFALAPSASLATLFLAPASFLAETYFGPLYSALQSIAPPNMRALAPACATLGNTVLGLGLAPPLLGWLTDLWTPSLGADAIRYSLSVMLLVHFAAACHLLLAARTLREDLKPGGGSVSD